MMTIDHYEIQNRFGDVKGKTLDRNVAAIELQALKSKFPAPDLSLYAIARNGKKLKIDPKTGRVI